MADPLNVSMPTLPITSRVSGSATKSVPSEYITSQEIAPAMEEQRMARADIKQQMGGAEAEIGKLELERGVAKAEEGVRLRQEELTRGQEAPERERLRMAREELSNAAFIPTKQTTTDLATLFSLMSIVGMAIGGEGRANAYAGMAAMNGMLEGYQKGRSDLYKQERDKFDKNLKAMQLKVQTLETELKDALDTYKNDRLLGEQMAEVAFAKANSPIIEQKAKKQGLESAYQFVVDTSKDMDKLVNLSNQQVQRAEDMKFKQKQLAQQEELKRAQMANTAELARMRMENQGQKVTQQQMMAQRAVNSLGGVASALESLSELPAGTTTGLFPNLQTKDGFLNYVRNNIGRKLSTNEAEMMNTIFTGIGRNLASIEASGAATGLTQLANQMQSGLYINEGTDDPYRVGIKLADIRRIATENIRPAIESGLMPAQQAATAEALVKRIEQAIPFTTTDVIRSARQPGAETIGQQTSRVVGGGGGGWSEEKERRMRELEAKKAAREAGR
jgi:hypothetical protein